MAHEMFVESSIRGYHAYFKNSTVCIGEVMECELEMDNDYDACAVVVKKESGEIVGHVPIELSKIFYKFLTDYGEIEAESIGCRYNAGGGKGLEIPVDYKLSGNRQYLENIRTNLGNNSFGYQLNISPVTVCTGQSPQSDH